ncbi:Asp-tRNA(Asn)/Glu-tRNA(Gln) amidotransferase subunit GatA [Roseivirga misakiensis]|uniref:Glutamyl-tRNA(Gln) amidotransferase subunit A n=1 Tax=Roseivirga misakiensis TaxID=1563681 RepID=A0A1E5T270_9BACT|nr:Asp-tRNA(Asn)/Glu-tRNA(Gln) amidotransferase subunit GatA [Roseivirga misakiensis]OEK05472.1 glutaminyl-tRNA synthase (glutamine-hydrolyzing) subunit A [Roseivirga misakiensis]
MKNYHRLDEIQTDLKLQKVSCLQLVEHHLQVIKENLHLNVFLEVFDEEARAQAKAIDNKLKHNQAGKLAGLIFGIKDLICYQNHSVTGSSKILEGFDSQITATAVQRILDEDAIVIGRQNCDEFGMGSSNENSAFGAVKNAIDETRVPGGSSGGSAVAVQANMCQISLGTDTGGSVRQPAAFTGTVGLKPTYSRISRWGLLAYASSFDTIGIISKSVDDNARVLEIIAGKDQNDGTSSSEPVDVYAKELPGDKKYKIAYLRESIESDAVAEPIKKSMASTIDKLKNQGHIVEQASFDLLDYVLPTYYILTTAEASTNLSRYDGVHFGHRSKSSDNLESLYKNSRTEGFGEEVKRRIMLGTFVLSANYYDAYFTKAQKARKLIKEATEKILEEYDFIIIPTTPTTAFKLGQHHDNPVESYLADLFTVQASVTGVPAISVPIGIDENNLPIGMQIMSRAFDETKLFAFSKCLLEEK